MKPKIIVISGVVIVAIIVCAYVFDTLDVSKKATGSSQNIDSHDQKQKVEIASIASLSSNQEPIELFGQVVSASGVSVVPEIGGVVSRVYKRIGDTVNAGQLVIELQNSSQRQAVAQAQAGLDSAKASLQLVRDGAGAEMIASAQSAVTAQESALAQSIQGTLGRLDAGYIDLERQLAVLDGLFFTNAEGLSPKISVSFFSQAQEAQLQEQRRQVQKSLEQNRKYSDVDTAIQHHQDQVSVVLAIDSALSDVVDTLEAAGALSQATIDNWKVQIDSVADQLDSLKAQVVALEAGLKERRQAVTSAKVSLQELENGADASDVAVAQAGVSNAQAALQSALIALEKTRITSPIRGRIASLDVRSGSLVGAAPVFEVSNNNTLRIDAYVSDTQAALIRAGDQALVDQKYRARVSVVAPTVNDNSGKVKIELLFVDPDIRLVEGTGVGVEVLPETNNADQNSAVISVPISAVFVRGEQVYVYVVRDSRAVVTPIETKELFGDQVTVISGLNSKDKIVVFARAVEDDALIAPLTK